jgi:hypothetical protein
VNGPVWGRVGQSFIAAGNGNFPLTPDREFETFALFRRRKPHRFQRPLGGNPVAFGFSGPTRRWLTPSRPGRDSKGPRPVPSIPHAKLGNVKRHSGLTPPALARALEAAGVEFTDGEAPGVRLRPKA